MGLPKLAKLLAAVTLACVGAIAFYAARPTPSHAPQVVQSSLEAALKYEQEHAPASLVCKAFDFEQSDHPYPVRIVNKITQRVLYATADNWENGVGMRTASDHVKADEKWMFCKISNGTYRIRNAASYRDLFAWRGVTTLQSIRDLPVRSVMFDTASSLLAADSYSKVASISWNVRNASDQINAEEKCRIRKRQSLSSNAVEVKLPADSYWDDLEVLCGAYSPPNFTDTFTNACGVVTPFLNTWKVDEEDSLFPIGACAPEPPTTTAPSRDKTIQGPIQGSRAIFESFSRTTAMRRE